MMGPYKKQLYGVRAGHARAREAPSRGQVPGPTDRTDHPVAPPARPRACFVLCVIHSVWRPTMPLPSMLGIAAHQQANMQDLKQMCPEPLFGPPRLKHEKTEQRVPSRLARQNSDGDEGAALQPARLPSRPKCAVSPSTDTPSSTSDELDTCNSQKRSSVDREDAAPNASAEPSAKRRCTQDNHITLFVDRYKDDAVQFQLRRKDGGEGELTDSARSNLLIELAMAKGDRGQEDLVCEHYGIHRNTSRALLRRWQQRASVSTACRPGRPAAVKIPAPPAAAAPIPVSEAASVQHNYLRLYADRDKAEAPRFQLRLKGGIGKRGELTVDARVNLLVELGRVTGWRDAELRVCQHYGVHRNTAREMLKRWRQRGSVSTAHRSGRPRLQPHAVPPTETPQADSLPTAAAAEVAALTDAKGRAAPRSGRPDSQPHPVPPTEPPPADLLPTTSTGGSDAGASKHAQGHVDCVDVSTAALDPPVAQSQVVSGDAEAAAYARIIDTVYQNNEKQHKQSMAPAKRYLFARVFREGVGCSVVDILNGLERREPDAKSNVQAAWKWACENCETLDRTQNHLKYTRAVCKAIIKRLANDDNAKLDCSLPSRLNKKLG